MRRSRSFTTICSLVGFWLAGLGWVGGGLEPAAASDDASLLTAADIERKRAELDEATTLSAEVREQIAEQFAKATELLEAATQATVRTKALEAEAASGPDELVRLEKLIATPPSPAPSLAELPERIEEVRAVHREAETTTADARQRLTALIAELERRTTRGRELPDLVAQVKARLKTVAEMLAAAPTPGEPSELMAARRLRLECSRQHRTAELALLEQELRTLVATERLVALRQARLPAGWPPWPAAWPSGSRRRQLPGPTRRTGRRSWPIRRFVRRPLKTRRLPRRTLGSWMPPKMLGPSSARSRRSGTSSASNMPRPAGMPKRLDSPRRSG